MKSSTRQQLKVWFRGCDILLADPDFPGTSLSSSNQNHSTAEPQASIGNCEHGQDGIEEPCHAIIIYSCANLLIRTQQSPNHR